LSGSPRTLPTRADAAGGTAVKFYELRDNLGLRRRMVETYGARGWNTGFWVGRRGALRRETAETLMTEALLAQDGFAPTGEQPFFNYLLDVGGIATASLRDNSPLTDPPPSLVVRPAAQVLEDAPALHWAGRAQPSLTMPLISVWLPIRLRATRPRSWGRLAAVLLVHSFRVGRREMWCRLRGSGGKGRLLRWRPR
jgi:hypothetical protein